MSLHSSSTEQEILHVREDGRLLSFSYGSIMNYHGGAMPAGVALAFRLFSGLTLRYKTLFDAVPDRNSVSFYTGLGENGKGIIDTAEMLYRVRSRGRLYTDMQICREKSAPDAPGGGKYFFSGNLGSMAWEAYLQDGIIGRDFFDISKRMHKIHDEGKEPAKGEIAELMCVRKQAEEKLLMLTPDDLFLFKIKVRS